MKRGSVVAGKLPVMRNSLSPRRSGEWDRVRLSQTEVKKSIATRLRKTKTELAKAKAVVATDSRINQLKNWG